MEFWGESIMTAAHIINRTPSPLLDGKSPYEVLHGKPPAFDLLCVFGCLCFAHRRARNKDKFSDRSRKCIFVGYLFGTKGWRLFDIERNEFFVSRDVTFFEEQFPGVTDTSYVSPPVMQTTEPIDDWLDPVLDLRGSTLPPAVEPSLPVTTMTPAPSPSTTSLEHPVVPVDALSGDTPPVPVSTTVPSVPSVPVLASSPDIEPPGPSSPGLLEVLGRGQITKKPSILLKNFITHASTTMTPPPHDLSLSDSSPLTTAPGKTPYPIANFLSTSAFNAKHRVFLVTITTESVPRTYAEAVRDPRCYEN